MKILVTGGAGFIGSHTVDALVATGQHQVSILDNLTTGKRHQLNPHARFHEIDLRDADAVRRAIEAETPEVIVHLAAQMDVRRSVADPSFDAQVNVVEAERVSHAPGILPDRFSPARSRAASRAGLQACRSPSW